MLSDEVKLKIIRHVTWTQVVAAYLFIYREFDEQQYHLKEIWTKIVRQNYL